MNTRSAGSFVVFLLCSVTLGAQDVGQNGSQNVSPTVSPSVSLDQRIAQLSSVGKTGSEYRLGPGDLIQVAVFGVEKFNHTVRISASGAIKLPLVDPIAAAGLTAAELEQRIASLLEGDLIRNPQVSVFVKEYRSQPVTILGAVRNPGQYQITQQLNIVDILSMAGGVLSSAVDTAVIQRHTAESDSNGNPEDRSKSEEIIKVNLKELLEKGDLSLNVPVRGGDVVNIQERLNQVFYVVGDVNRGGVFQLPPKQDVRVSQAFAAAGGPTRTAKVSQGMLVRYENGERQQLPVNFNDILKGKTEDPVIHADDIIFVPGSRIKDVLSGVLASVPGAVTQMPYSLMYLVH